MSNTHMKARPGFYQHRPPALLRSNAAACSDGGQGWTAPWLKTDFADHLGDQSTDAGSGHSSPRLFESPESQLKAQQVSPGSSLRESLRAQGNAFLGFQARCNQQGNHDGQKRTQQLKQQGQRQRPRANKEHMAQWERAAVRSPEAAVLQERMPLAEGCAAASLMRPEAPGQFHSVNSEDVRHLSNLSIPELLKLSYPDFAAPQPNHLGFLGTQPPPSLYANLNMASEHDPFRGMAAPPMPFIRPPPGLECEGAPVMLHL